MTTTVKVLPKGQMDLPAAFCKRQKIRPGAALRVTEVGDGLYVTPLPEPSEKELRQVIAAAGSLRRAETEEDEALVQRVITDYRKETRRHRR